MNGAAGPGLAADDAGADVTVTWALPLAVILSPFWDWPDAVTVLVKLAATPESEQL